MQYISQEQIVVDMFRYVWTMELGDPGKAGDFREHWRQVSSVLQTYPGALGSHLHEVTDGPGDFLMIGEWESKEARDAMHEDIHHGDSEAAQRWRNLPPDNVFGRILLVTAVEVETIMPEDLV